MTDPREENLKERAVAHRLMGIEGLCGICYHWLPSTMFLVSGYCRQSRKTRFAREGKRCLDFLSGPPRAGKSKI